MNDQQLDNKVRRDEARLKKDIISLVENRAAQFSRLEGSLVKSAGKAQKGLGAWFEESTARVSKEMKKLTGSTKETVTDAAGKAKKNFSHTLRQFNTKAQKAADRIPVRFSKKADRSPWVAISIGVALVGILLGIILKPARTQLG